MGVCQFFTNVSTGRRHTVSQIYIVPLILVTTIDVVLTHVVLRKRERM